MSDKRLTISVTGHPYLTYNEHTKKANYTFVLKERKWVLESPFLFRGDTIHECMTMILQVYADGGEKGRRLRRVSVVENRQPNLDRAALWYRKVVKGKVVKDVEMEATCQIPVTVHKDVGRVGSSEGRFLVPAVNKSFNDDSSNAALGGESLGHVELKLCVLEEGITKESKKDTPTIADEVAIIDAMKPSGGGCGKKKKEAMSEVEEMEAKAVRDQWQQHGRYKEQADTNQLKADLQEQECEWVAATFGALNDACDKVEAEQAKKKQKKQQARSGLKTSEQGSAAKQASLEDLEAEDKEVDEAFKRRDANKAMKRQKHEDDCLKEEEDGDGSEGDNDLFDDDSSSDDCQQPAQKRKKLEVVTDLTE